MFCIFLAGCVSLGVGGLIDLFPDKHHYFTQLLHVLRIMQRQQLFIDSQERATLLKRHGTN